VTGKTDFSLSVLLERVGSETQPNNPTPSEKPQSSSYKPTYKPTSSEVSFMLYIIRRPL